MKLSKNGSYFILLFSTFASAVLHISESRVNYTTRSPRKFTSKNVTTTTVSTITTSTEEPISSTTENTPTTKRSPAQPKINNNQQMIKKKIQETKKTEAYLKNKTQIQHDSFVQTQWRDLESGFQKFALRFVLETLMPTIEPLFHDNHVSSKCQSSIRTVLHDAARLKKYAIQSKCYFLIVQF
jgi:hypothetical protein